MKQILLSSVMCLFLCSCQKAKNINIETYDYDDEEMTKYAIDWEGVFLQSEKDYFVYVYSKTCGYCNEIKQKVLSKVVEENPKIYLVEYSEKVPIITDSKSIIGKQNIEEIGIVGTPSLFEIYNYVLVDNIVGGKAIIETLTNRN